MTGRRTTREVVQILRERHPAAGITEDRIRHAIRRGDVTPETWGGRLAWSVSDVDRLEAALVSSAPSEAQA